MRKENIVGERVTKVRKRSWEVHVLGKQKKFLTTIGKKQCILIFQEKYQMILRSSLLSVKIVVIYWYTARNNSVRISYTKKTLYDLCTMEILMNKAKCYREPASLNHNLCFNQKSHHNPLPQTRNQSWAWQYLLRKAVLCVGQLCVGIACVQKIALKEVVIKMIIVKNLSIISRTRVKATVITGGQYNRHFQIPFLG